MRIGFRKISTLLMVGTVSSALMAQTMTVTQNNGEEASYPLAQLEELTFDGGMLSVTSSGNNTDDYALEQLDFLGFSDGNVLFRDGFESEPGIPVPGASCDTLSTTCQGESCCTNFLVPGGTFPMGQGEFGSTDHESSASRYDFERPEHDVTVSSHYLDKYEVTVGRFRKFVESGSYVPAAGAGSNPHVGGTGWDAAWDDRLPADPAGWNTELLCAPGGVESYHTWTVSAGPNEDKPINCVSWYAAFAFCAWDGGRLPTEAEWEMAAAGGDENRKYPWEEPTKNLFYLNYECLGDGIVNCRFSDILPVGSRQMGAGRWGHQDLLGSMWEWTFDWNAPYSSSPKENPATVNPYYSSGDDTRSLRGGGWDFDTVDIRSATRSGASPEFREKSVGFRCAR